MKLSVAVGGASDRLLLTLGANAETTYNTVANGLGRRYDLPEVVVVEYRESGLHRVAGQVAGVDVQGELGSPWMFDRVW